jgi:hypothetical protein
MLARRQVLLAFVLMAGAAGTAMGAELTFALKIDSGHVPRNMRRIRVKQGDLVKLLWSTDRPMRLHLHGYDIEKEVVPGTVTEMTFNARATGRFTVSPHLGKEPDGGHAHGEALVTIEVHPK